MSRITGAVLVCAPDRGDPWRRVGGLPLIERLLRQLGRVDGLEEIVVVCSPAFPPIASTRWVRATVRRVDVDEATPWTMLRRAGDRLPERFVMAASDLVVDQRLFAWLVEQEGDVLIAARDGVPSELLGCMHRAALQLVALNLAAAVTLDTFPAYSKEQRGDVPIHLLRIRNEADVEPAWAILLDSVEKRTKDLPATLFDPPIENFLVRLLAPTRITPNQVTVLTTILGFFVAWLFLQGWLLSGVILAIAVEVLDGVDGKLARLKYMTSKLGELEHMLDFFYENSWWLSLGAWFAGQGAAWAWPAALMLCASDLADNFAYLFFKRRTPLPSEGRGARGDRSLNLDEATPLLSRFRLIAGRRNIYVWMLLPGVVFGFGSTAFALAVAWAVATAATHWYLAATIP